MPSHSKAQQGFLLKNKPALAKKWAKKYGVPKNLPAKKKEMPGMSQHFEVKCSQSARNNKSIVMGY